MKKYIKITKEITEEMAVAHFKNLGGMIYEDLLLNYKANGILVLDNYNDIFYTKNSEQILIECGYEESKLLSFELGEQIVVSNISKEEAIKELEGDNNNFYFTGGKTKNGEYIVEDDFGFICIWKYIAKIPKATPTKEYTMEQLQEKLGETFKLIK